MPSTECVYCGMIVQAPHDRLRCIEASTKAARELRATIEELYGEKS